MTIMIYVNNFYFDSFSILSYFIFYVIPKYIFTFLNDIFLTESIIYSNGFRNSEK